MALDMKGFGRLKWYYQVLVVGGICGGLLAGFWYQFLTPMQEQIVVKTKKMTDLKEVVAKSEARQKQLAKIKQEALELQAKLDKLKAALPLEKETDQIFRAVQQRATESGLNVRRVAPKATIDHEVYTEYPIDLEVGGTYHDVGGFLDSIRQLPRIVNVGSVKLNGLNAEGDNAARASVTAIYTATTFVYKEEPPPAPPKPASAKK